MQKVYLDNAATTVLDSAVWEEMKPYFLENYGNPSSSHFAGREAKAAVELARKKIASSIGALSSRLIFTSGATEANNLVFKFAQRDLGVQKVIVSPLEHHAVLNAAKAIFGDQIIYTKHNSCGVLDLVHLSRLISDNPNCLVSIMHINNEIGIINPIEKIAKICKQYKVLYHSDTVQSFAHVDVNLSQIEADFIVASAHKFHGPKGIGFLAFGQDFILTPDQYGGLQEKNLRAGTEAVPLIVGMSKALELHKKSLAEIEINDRKLKTYLVEELSKIEGVTFNAASDRLEGYLCSLINISLSKMFFNDMTLFTLDLNGIAISGGSACSSGAINGSHVLSYLNSNNDSIAIRVSFSKYTIQQDLDCFLIQLKGCQKANA